MQALFEIWVILWGFPSKFPALYQFYETTVRRLSPDQLGELVELTKHQVCAASGLLVLSTDVRSVNAVSGYSASPGTLISTTPAEKDGCEVTTSWSR